MSDTTDVLVSEADDEVLIEELAKRVVGNKALRYELKEELDLVDTTVEVSEKR